MATTFRPTGQRRKIIKQTSRVSLGLTTTAQFLPIALTRPMIGTDETRVVEEATLVRTRISMISALQATSSGASHLWALVWDDAATAANVPDPTQGGSQDLHGPYLFVEGQHLVAGNSESADRLMKWDIDTKAMRKISANEELLLGFKTDAGTCALNLYLTTWWKLTSEES